MPDFDLQGTHGKVVGRRWDPDGEPKLVVLLAHGIGEHSGRYEHVARHLNESEHAVVYAPDHYGHGRSEGERALVSSIDAMVTDLADVGVLAAEAHPDLPVALVGHSMGGLIATRYAQDHGDGLAALVLSAPAVGADPQLLGLADMDPMPDVPIDPAVLSRDPAVGEAYAADELVYHGPLLKESVLGLRTAMEQAAAGTGFGVLPTLWLHGEADELISLQAATAAMEPLRGSATEEKVYPGARHEIFNETNQDEVLGDVSDFLDRVVRR